MNAEIKQLNRKTRRIRLYYAVKAYSHYTQMELHRNLMVHGCDWNTAESTKELIEFFFPDRDVKTEELIHPESEELDKAMYHYDEYKLWAKCASFSGLPEKTIEAFCKYVEYSGSMCILRSMGHLHLPFWLDAIYAYLDGGTDKKGMLDRLVEYSIFDQRATPVRYSLLRMVISKTEQLINEIQFKQLSRAGKTIDDLNAETSELVQSYLGKMNTSIPF